MNRVLEKLRKLADDRRELSIGFESSPDEAVILGTKEAYINAAIKLLEIAEEKTEAEFEVDQLEKIQVNCSNHIKYAFDELGDVWPVVANLAKDQEQLNILKNYFLP